MAASIEIKNDDRKSSRNKRKAVHVNAKEKRNISNDYTPIHFTSKYLNLVPSNMAKTVEYLLYQKPTLSVRDRITTAVSTLLHRSSIMRVMVNKSILRFDSSRGFKNEDIGRSLSNMATGRKMSTHDKKQEIKHLQKGSSLFKMRTDPWPESEPRSKTFRIKISETSTMQLNFFQSRAAIEGTDRAIIVNEQNEGYWNRVKTYKKTYNVETQTPQPMRTNRHITMTKNTRFDVPIQVCYSDIYDSYMKVESGLHSQRTRDNAKSQDKIDIKNIDLTDEINVNDSKNVNHMETLIYEDQELNEACKIVDIVESSDFNDSFRALLRILDRASTWRNHITFMSPVVMDPLAEKCPITYNIGLLWSLRYLKIWGMPVTSMCVNPSNVGILAVGHGMYFMDQPQHLGRVCIWNIKNCSLPEKHMDFKDGVTSISFSKQHPFALLVSLISGEVHLVDISKPILQSLASYEAESPNEPIWQVRWFTFDSGEEQPVACGENGQIYLISKHSFNSKIFLNLSRREGVVKGIPLPEKCSKSIPVREKPSVKCIAANPDNRCSYLVGTDDGCVHLCSTDYWHEHIDVFQAHIGPVNHIKYHPDCSKIFLTVGIDYFLRIWAYGVFEELVCLYEIDFPIEDADWSPVNPNIIVTISSCHLSLWDISRIKLVSQGSIKSPTGSRFTTVNFSCNGSNLVCGDLSGDVHIFHLSNMPFHFNDKERVLRRTFRRLLLGKKILSESLKTVGFPFDGMDDEEF